MKSSKFYLRKTHRYFGLFIGIQFFLWSIGGLYFSWSDIDEIHGDNLIENKSSEDNSSIPLNKIPIVTPQIAIDSLNQMGEIDSLMSVKLVGVLGDLYYQIQYFSHNQDYIIEKTRLASAETGILRGSVTEKEAISIAQSHFYKKLAVKETEYVESIGSHHEYRESPLPVWAVTFDHTSSPTVYISAELGTFQKIRHNRWRIFDVLWMLHTMDYQGRDDFNNLILRVVSVLGLLTVVSGFVLFYISSPTIRKLKKKKKK
jgi:hypothetical protein